MCALCVCVYIGHVLLPVVVKAWKFPLDKSALHSTTLVTVYFYLSILTIQAVEFFVFAALMLVMTVIFATQSFFYQYVTVDVTNGYRDLDGDREALEQNRTERDRDFELTSTESDPPGNSGSQHPAYTNKQTWRNHHIFCSFHVVTVM